MRYRSLGRNSLRRLQTDHIDLRRQRHELSPGAHGSYRVGGDVLAGMTAAPFTS